MPGVFDDLHLTNRWQRDQGAGGNSNQPIGWYADILDSATISHVASKLDTSSADVARRLLWNQTPDLPPLTPDNPPASTVARDALIARWWGRHQTRVCLECRAELNGATLIVWQSAWTFACTIHQRLLTSICHVCRKSLQIIPTVPRQVPHTGACADHATPDATDLSAAPEIIETQIAINDARAAALDERDHTGKGVPFYDRLAEAHRTVQLGRKDTSNKVKSRLEDRAERLGLPKNSHILPSGSSQLRPAIPVALFAPEVWAVLARRRGTK